MEKTMKTRNRREVRWLATGALAAVGLLLTAFATTASAAIVEAESVLVSPVLSTAPSQTNNEYEDFAGWSPDSGNSLIVHKDETVAAADVPHLQVSGLTPGAFYQVQAITAYSPQNASGGTFTWDYSYSSAADAITAPLLFDNSRLSAGTPGASGAGTPLSYMLSAQAADAGGNINLYFGNKSQNTTVNAYSGIDQIEVTLTSSAVFEAESVLVSPVLSTAPSQANNEYENFAGWTPDSGRSLIVHKDETVAAADVPHLQISGLTPGAIYQVQAVTAYSPQNAGGGTFTWDYSYSSAADAITAPLMFDNSRLSAGTPGASAAGTPLSYLLNAKAADAGGNIDLYFGNKSQNTSVNAYSGIDQIEVTFDRTAPVGKVAIPVTNGSFEHPVVVGDGNFSPAGATGWTPFNAGVVNSSNNHFTGTNGPAGFLPGTADGLQFSGTGFGQGPGTGGAGNLYQGIGTDLAADMIYTLTVAAGDRLDQALPASGMMELRAGSHTGTLLGSLDVMAGALGGMAFDAVYPSAPPSDSFQDYAFSVDTADFPLEVGSEIFIVFDSPAGGQVAWDNVRLDAVIAPKGEIPEPATLAALGLAVGGLGGYVRKRKRS